MQDTQRPQGPTWTKDELTTLHALSWGNKPTLPAKRLSPAMDGIRANVGALDLGNDYEVRRFWKAHNLGEALRRSRMKETPPPDVPPEADAKLTKDEATVLRLLANGHSFESARARFKSRAVSTPATKRQRKRNPFLIPKEKKASAFHKAYAGLRKKTHPLDLSITSAVRQWQTKHEAAKRRPFLVPRFGVPTPMQLRVLRLYVQEPPLSVEQIADAMLWTGPNYKVQVASAILHGCRRGYIASAEYGKKWAIRQYLQRLDNGDPEPHLFAPSAGVGKIYPDPATPHACLLYTSDAADE